MRLRRELPCTKKKKTLQFWRSNAGEKTKRGQNCQTFALLTHLSA
jgi:hypothetical protein